MTFMPTAIFLSTFFISSSKERLQSLWTPKFFTIFVSRTVHPLTTISSILFLLGAPKIMNSDLLSFTFSSFFLKKRMSLAILFSRCNFDSEIVFPLQKIKVSSAYWLILELTSVSSFISFTYMLKSSGPSTVPCGTPRLSAIQFDSYFENLIFCTRFSR